MIKKKRQKVQKKCAIKRKLKLQDYKNCLKATQLDRKLNQLKEKIISLDCLKGHQKDFVIKNFFEETKKQCRQSYIISKRICKKNITRITKI